MSDAAPQPETRVPLPVNEHEPAAYEGPSREEILALRREYLNPGIMTYYDDPICIVEGHLQYVWDEQGRQYLDAAGGIVTVSVGHCHPRVTERLRTRSAGYATRPRSTCTRPSPSTPASWPSTCPRVPA